VFDPATIGAGDAKLVRDLPGDSIRLTTEAHGIHRVLVNGVAIVADGRPTGATPGTLLRSGRDTTSL
jgi:N-acyl-D-aspartate/D-glutamate deacylase